ncbi:hypothetical protein [Erythrobacter sp. THAF29]|uniref:hypothetical protein n=1 Tax=Erythrobacter sp. THAF29 TaxID=2587851 RepID=UPI0012684341|nr:hypothetical protein [Erythrobacter sp. THAF29]QFT77802.1 hypothetical protein FIU90_09670 [Erythrobacter sp. THAF29]
MEEKTHAKDGSSKIPLLANRPFVVGVLFILGLWTGFSVLVGVALAYLFRSREHEAWEASHFEFLIRTFWIGFAAFVMLVPAMIIATVETNAPFWMFGLGVVLLLVVVFTSARTVLSIMRAIEAKPMPNPGSLTFGN